MEEEKQIESVRDQFPMLPFPYKSNNTLHRIAGRIHRSCGVGGARAGSKFSVDVAIVNNKRDAIRHIVTQYDAARFA